MSVAQNDVNVQVVETRDQDGVAGDPLEVKVTAEVGTALHATGGQYRLRLTLTDTTDPQLLDTQEITGNFGDAGWPAAGRNVFTFTIPGAATSGRAGDLVEPQARLFGNAAAPFDASHVIGDSLLLTP